MRVGLFVPCYMDAFEPEVGIATLELLERLGCDVEYPFDQTCCGQPMTNTGCHADAAGAEALFVKNFSSFDYIVAPSGSCVHQIRVNMTSVEQSHEAQAVRDRTVELTEFLHDVLHVRDFPWAHFPHKVGIHYNCNSLRGIHLASPTEIKAPFFSKPRALLEKVSGVEFVEPARWDECCGFGGSFSVFEPSVSVRMGRDKIADHSRAGAEYIVSADSSCLLHLADVDVAVVRAILGVAETGSVLFTERELKVNTVAYLAQHLVVLLARDAIVPGIQDAYDNPAFRSAHYAVFHTGPSATGDIEGVLIHGAQGVRSLTVILTG